MKAAIYTHYGPPEVIIIKEIEKPIPNEKQVLVKIQCSTVNRTDSGFRSAEYFVSRFWSGLFKPNYQVLGCEFSGTIENVGNKVTEFKIGDKVFGFNDKSFGGHTEYLCIDADQGISIAPDNINLNTAAAIAEGSHYALVDIRAAQVKKGQEVLVYGASGAIGSAAVQLLKYFGATVTAVCNSKNVELVKSLGADLVIDYQTADFTKTQTKYHFIFDAVGKSSYGVCKSLLTENGIYISTELGKNGENILYALLSKFSKGKKLLFPIPSFNQEDARFLKMLVQEGHFKPIIDRSYPLDEIVEAYHYVESGQKTGNVLLQIGN